MDARDQADGFHGPLLAELPLDGLEAFRLASFNIEYVPQYAPIRWDAANADSSQFYVERIVRFYPPNRFLGRISSE